MNVQSVILFSLASFFLGASFALVSLHYLMNKQLHLQIARALLLKLSSLCKWVRSNTQNKWLRSQTARLWKYSFRTSLAIKVTQNEIS